MWLFDILIVFFAGISVGHLATTWHETRCCTCASEAQAEWRRRHAAGLGCDIGGHCHHPDGKLPL